MKFEHLKPLTLNLVTPLFRSGKLQRLKASIPETNYINWIVVLCGEREILKDECNKLNIPYISINQPDNKHSIHHKINASYEHLKPGFFQGLDDDTQFCPNSLEAVLRYGNEFDIIIGEQSLQDGTKRPAQEPKRCYTDGAQMLVNTEIIKQHPMISLPDDPQNDCELMLRCWNSTDKRLILHEVVSYYNWTR